MQLAEHQGSLKDKLQIQTLQEQKLGAKTILTAYHKRDGALALSRRFADVLTMTSGGYLLNANFSDCFSNSLYLFKNLLVKFQPLMIKSD